MQLVALYGSVTSTKPPPETSHRSGPIFLVSDTEPRGAGFKILDRIAVTFYFESTVTQRFEQRLASDSPFRGLFSSKRYLTG